MKKLYSLVLVASLLPAICLAQTDTAATGAAAAAPTAPVVPAAPALPMAANPEGIAVMDFKTEFNEGIQGSLSHFQDKCGYALTTDFNYGNLSQGTSEEDRYSVHMFCEAPLTKLTTICEKGDSYKAAVAAKVKSFTCRYLGDNVTPTLTVEAGALVWSFDHKTPNHDLLVEKVLMGIL
jgi:hypothetical protein